jgi:hypothetical protein
MNYSQPQLEMLGTALRAVQSPNALKLDNMFDGDPRYTATSTAYEADE